MFKDGILLFDCNQYQHPMDLALQIWKKMDEYAEENVVFEDLLERINIRLERLNVLLIIQNVDFLSKNVNKDVREDTKIMLESLLRLNKNLKLLLTSTFKFGDLGTFDERVVELN